MNSTAQNQKGYATLLLLLVLFVSVGILGIVYYINKDTVQSKSLYSNNYYSKINRNEEQIQTEIVYFQDHERFKYEIELLKKILEVTKDEYGVYELKAHELDMNEGRGIALLEEGEVDIAFLPTTIEREEKFLPIKFPLNKGMLGYRVFLIHRDNIETFRNVESLFELSTNYTAGFGSQWADLAILKENSVKVEGVDDYEGIIEGIESKRFDYFPRGLGEAWIEYETYREKYPNVVVEENLALHYPYVRYYFLNKNNEALAQRIQSGLEILDNNGELKNLFDANFSKIIEQANISERKTFNLTNSTLPETNIDTEWWLNKDE